MTAPDERGWLATLPVIRIVAVLTFAASSWIFGVSTAGAAHRVRPPELLYVANASSGPVTAYLAGSLGAVRPVRRLRNPQDPNTFWDPWGVAVDTAGNSYVQTFLSDATSFVFGRGRSIPGRIFRVAGPDSENVAVDGHGYEYVLGGEGPPVISVAAPGAAGNPSSLYSVSLIRQIRIDQPIFNPWPAGLTVDHRGHVLAAVLRPTGNEIEVYEGGPSGSGIPVRTIAGASTGLGSCSGFGRCDHVSLTFSPHTGRIYAAVSGAAGAHIAVFAGTASGDVSPVRVISGPRTGLDGKVVTGIAGSQRTGDIYVLAKNTQFQGTGTVEAFGRLAAGNAAPLRSFTDVASRLADGQGIAITP